MLKSLLKIARSAGRSIESAINDITAGLGLLITAPFYDLKRSTSATKGETRKPLTFKGIFTWPLRLLLAFVSMIGRMLISPAELMVGLVRLKTSQILWAIPWVIGFCGLMFLIYTGWFNTEARLTKLRKQAAEQFEAGNLAEAEHLYTQLIRQSEVAKQPDLFQYYLTLAKLGKKDRSLQVLESLAPPSSQNPGYPKAHEFVAINIVDQFSRTPANPQSLKTLKWHLDCSGGVNSPAINRCWAEYYLGINDKENALKYMARAAELNSDYFVGVANIYREMGNPQLEKQSLEKARDHFHDLVESKPLEHRNRIVYATILNRLNRIDSAENVLLTGYNLKTDALIARAVSDFYLARFVKETSATYQQRFDMLSNSLHYDPNNIDTYQAMIQFYRSLNQDAPVKKTAIESLEKIISGEQPPALAFFALSNILWTEEEFQRSQQLMEQAFTIDSSYALVANNLAWLLAHAKPPEMKRALELAQKAVEAQPENGRIRDTLGTILMLQEKADDALAEFTIALQKPIASMETKRKIHSKMASIYRQLGKPELAKNHEEQANLTSN